MISGNGRKIIRIILFILAIAVIVLATEAAIELIFMENHEPSYFVKHFSLGTSLIIIGVMAFLMTQVAKRRYEGGKGDEMMLVVSVLLILCGFIAYLISYFNIY